MMHNLTDHSFEHTLTASSSDHTLIISNEIYRSIIAHCESQLPNEACGLLVAGAQSDTVVERYIPIPNRHPEPLHAFAFDPIGWTAALYDVDRLEQNVIGYYHSHPTTPAAPSQSDITGHPASSSTFMLILSFASSMPIARAYWFTQGENPNTPFTEAGLHIV